MHHLVNIGLAVFGAWCAFSLLVVLAWLAACELTARRARSRRRRDGLAISGSLH